MPDTTSPTPRGAPPERLRLNIPTPVLELVAALSELGGPAWLVGEGLSDALLGYVPRAFQICAATPASAWLARFPHAVPTRPADGVVMIPTASGPVDVSAPRSGEHVQGDLERRCLTLHAMAWNPVDGEWLDPFDGYADAQAERLRTVGDPSSRLAEDPIRALRVVRLAARLGYRVDPTLHAALRGALQPLTPALRLRARRELTGLLLSPEAGAGVDLLRSSGLEELLVPEAQGDSGAVIGQLPPVLALRLAAWLRGTNAPRELARLRIGRDLGIRVQRLLRHHPIDAAHLAGERVLRRLDDDDVAALFALRRAEVMAAQLYSEQPSSHPALPSLPDLERAEKKIRGLRRAAAAAHQAGPLALGGAEIMQLLGCGPGPQIGRALGFLARCVADDPACNNKAALEQQLESWARSGATSTPRSKPPSGARADDDKAEGPARW